MSSTDRALTIRLAPELIDRLHVAALVCGESAADIIRTALDTHLGDIERTSTYKRRRAELIIATTQPDTKPRTRAIGKPS